MGEDQKTSAIRAGFTPNGASCQATKISKLPEVQERIKELTEKRNRKFES